MYKNNGTFVHVCLVQEHLFLYQTNMDDNQQLALFTCSDFCAEKASEGGQMQSVWMRSRMEMSVKL